MPQGSPKKIQIDLLLADLYAGNQRADLRDPDDQAVEKPHSLDRSLMPRDQLDKAERRRSFFAHPRLA